jgi:hypothetical protein
MYSVQHKHSYVRAADIPTTLTKSNKAVDFWNFSAELPISTVRVEETCTLKKNKSSDILVHVYQWTWRQIQVTQ